jgi:hypothetical protein
MKEKARSDAGFFVSALPVESASPCPGWIAQKWI